MTAERNCYDRQVSDPGRPAPRPRSESRETIELRAIRERQPELAEAVDMHLELLELQRRIQGRVPLPSLDLSAETIARHQAEGRPAAPLRRHPARVERSATDGAADGRRPETLRSARRYRLPEGAGDRPRHETAGGGRRVVSQHRRTQRGRTGSTRPRRPAGRPRGYSDAMSEVLGLAMRPFLSRCAEVLQQRPDLALWTHPHCALCGGAPDFAVITPAAERHLICGRCALRWKFEPLTCPFCANSDRYAHHVIRCPPRRRRLSRLRLRRLPPLPQGVRRATRRPSGDAGRRRASRRCRSTRRRCSGDIRARGILNSECRIQKCRIRIAKFNYSNPVART